jgi:hypothetical protein
MRSWIVNLIGSIGGRIFQEIRYVGNVSIQEYQNGLKKEVMGFTRLSYVIDYAFDNAIQTTKVISWLTDDLPPSIGMMITPPKVTK